MKRIKKSNSCKYVSDFKIDRNILKTHKPKAGDVAIFKVMEIGWSNAIQDFEGRNCFIFEGDQVLLTFGNRYASNQFEAYVPDGYQEEYDLVSKGGIAANVASMYFELEDIGATKLKLIGYATDGKNVINSIYHHRKEEQFEPFTQNNFKTILALGSSMDSGKTTTAAFLCRGLKKAGHKVAYIKLTGTVYNKDRMLCYDCGADYVSDFSEFGYPSTYLCSIDEILNIYAGLLKDVAAQNPDYLVIEIADGLYQGETNELINHLPFTDAIDHVILSCSDSLAVHTGVGILSPIFGEKLFALGGLFTGSPLLVDEVQKRSTLPVLTLEKLADGKLLGKLLQTKVIKMAI